MTTRSRDAAVIIEARMGSTRLPGKHLLPVCERPIIQHLINRMRKVNGVSEVIVATTTDAKDDILVDCLSKANIPFYRGSEKNVMLRVIEAAEKYKIHTIVEVTGDCPCIDINIVEAAIQTYDLNEVDYVTNNKYPQLPDGMDVQVFCIDTLKRSSKLTNKPDHLEHVTLHIKDNPKKFRTINLGAPYNLRKPKLRLTLDYPSDYTLLKNIIEHFGFDNMDYSIEDILDFIQKNEQNDRYHSA